MLSLENFLWHKNNGLQYYENYQKTQTDNKHYEFLNKSKLPINIYSF